MSLKLAVIYYSSTGTVDAVAQRVALAGEKAGAEVRLRHIEEIAPPAAIDGSPYGVSHVTGPENDAPLEDAALHALDHLVERALTVAGKLAG